MVLFVISIILINSVAYKIKKHLTKNQIVHIWKFTTIFVTFFDIFIDEKKGGYWYFDNGIGWTNLLVYTILIPPVSVIFLSWYPFNSSWLKIIRYFVFWILFISGYELIALLPEPWGYFHYGWWNMYYSLLLDPILLIILLAYYRFICKIEMN